MPQPMVCILALVVGLAAAAASLPMAAAAAATQHWAVNYDRTWRVQDNGQVTDALLVDILNQPAATALAHLRTDFCEISRVAGADAVRVFVQLDQIVAADGGGVVVANATAIAALDLVSQAAEACNVTWLLTGVAVQRPDTAASWLSTATDDTIAAARELFWRSVAQHFKGDAAVLGFDLINEMYTAWNDTTELVTGCFNMRTEQRYCYTHTLWRQVRAQWTYYVHSAYSTPQNLSAHWPDFPRKGESWANIAIPDERNGTDPRRAEYTLGFQRGGVRAFCENMTSAIKAADPSRVVTKGELFPAGAGVCGEFVDVYSLHLYPSPSMVNATAAQRAWAKDVAWLPDDGKPMWVEEYAPLNAAPGITMQELLGALLNATRSRATAWFSFYWGSARHLNETGVAAEVYNAMVDSWRQGRPW